MHTGSNKPVKFGKTGICVQVTHQDGSQESIDLTAKTTAVEQANKEAAQSQIPDVEELHRLLDEN